MFVVLTVSILVLALLGRPPIWIGILSRVALLPLIAATSYEIIKWSATRQQNPFVRSITFPGLLLQRLVTREPDDSQAEAAIAAWERCAEVVVCAGDQVLVNAFTLASIRHSRETRPRPI